MAVATRLYRCVACNNGLTACLKDNEIHICRDCREKNCQRKDTKKSHRDGKRLICTECD